MKILALNWNDLKNPYAGGAEVQLEEMLRRMVQYGHEVTLFCSGFRGCAKEEVVEGIRIIRRGFRYNFNLVAPFGLRPLVANEKFDIMVEDINKIPFYTPLYLDIKTLVLIPHLFATTVFYETNFLLGSYVYLAEQPLVRMYKGCDFQCPSKSTRDELIERGVPADKVTIVNNGIDENFFVYDPAVPKYDRPTVLYLGRIKKYKSVQHLIEAFARVREKLNDAQLMIVGAGGYTDNLKRQASSLGLTDCVEFPGFVSAENKLERLRRSHVAVLPSLKEGWGLTNIEANAVGTTVIAANTPGLRDSVRDGETGFLFEYGNIDELTNRLMRVLTNEEQRKQLEKNGRVWADNFSWDKSAKHFEQELLRLTEGQE
ncbi:MAG TPA: glycosyltransferase family 4 protein [candidate division Zixibacteria bacterium]|nr:glycosyltransferase family 4 protein [candidate division Zixibacteria bacterium]